jgi:hypothetical protein
MANNLEYYFKDTVQEMADSLIEYAEHNEVSLEGLTIDNFNTLLDDRFDDGGYARCEKFTDLAWPYSFQFGEIESNAQSNAQWKCIKAAIKEVNKRLEGK